MPRVKRARECLFSNRHIRLKRVEELGRFQLGSTVMLLFLKGVVQFNTTWAPGLAIRLGEAMAGA